MYAVGLVGIQPEQVYRAAGLKLYTCSCSRKDGIERGLQPGRRRDDLSDFSPQNDPDVSFCVLYSVYFVRFDVAGGEGSQTTTTVTESHGCSQGLDLLLLRQYIY